MSAAWFRHSLILCLFIGPNTATTLHAQSDDANSDITRPNIVIFYADDMGIGDVGAYGCEDIRTPNIDALAAEGIRFTNYYSAAPICSPSRAALLTGRYPQRAGVPTNVGSIPGSPGLPPEQITLGEVARSQGYATALIGKWHLGHKPGHLPNDQGFDFFFGHHAGCIDYFSHTFYWNARAPHHHDLYRNRVEIHEEGQYFTHLIAREATRFIDDHHAEPFLLYVPFNAPHYPTHAPKRYLDMYRHLPRERQLYAGLVAPMDEAIGHVMRRLDRYQLRSRTAVFFMSDNGPSVESRANFGGGSAGPHREYKFSLFEGGIRMPGIVAWPGQMPAGETRDQLACAIDVLPTVAAMIGAKLPDDHVVDGRSWVPLLRDASEPGHDALFWEWNKQAAVRRGKWKLVRNGIIMPERGVQKRAEGPDTLFLSDLERDAGESRNLRTTHPDIVERLLAMHEEWRSLHSSP